MAGQPAAVHRVALPTIAREWARIGCIGFGGPPAHISLLRRLCVEQRRWLSPDEFEDGIAATNLLPGPASTQLAIFCAWRLRGSLGGVIGGLGFVVPGLIVILALSALFLEARPPLWVAGAAAGAGAAVPAVAIQAATRLAAPSLARARASPGGASPVGWIRWLVYLLAGVLAAALAGPYLVLAMAACGIVEVGVQARSPTVASSAALPLPIATAGGMLGVAWVALKVGLLSYGGGFVIVPLMQHDAVQGYHWMTSTQFLDAVALGQITPGPVVHTVAAVGYVAAGLGGGLIAALVAFTPSFLFVLLGGPHFTRLRRSRPLQAFLAGAGPAAIGAIAGSSIPLGLALVEPWQFALLVAAGGWLLILRRDVVSALVLSGVLGVVAVLAGAPVGG